MLTKHKTAKHGKLRVLVFEAEAQELLRPFMLRPADRCLFSPGEFARVSLKGRRADHTPTRKPGRFNDQYDAHGLRLAVERATRRANRDRTEKGLPKLPHWTPYQLRHAGATTIALAGNEEDARTLLGHSSRATTQRYLHAEVERAKNASKRVRASRSGTTAICDSEAPDNATTYQVVISVHDELLRQH